MLKNILGTPNSLFGFVKSGFRNWCSTIQMETACVRCDVDRTQQTSVCLSMDDIQ